MTVESHAHVWVFDWEDPPGHVCSIADCNAATGACGNCEGPTTREFCSEVCASEFEDAISDDPATPAGKP